MKSLPALGLALLLTGCVSHETSPEPPDFYDRQGNACWREADFIWCDDGYNSDADRGAD